MFPTTIARAVLTAAPFTALLAAAPAAAQGPPTKAILVPCCKCADGSVQTVDISTGAAPWRVSPPSGAPAAAVPVPTSSIPSTWTTALAPAVWVQHPAGEADGTFDYELRFQVQKCAIKPDVTISGQFSADNSATLTVGGPTPVFTAPGSTAYTSTFPFSVPAAIGAGAIEVKVVNNEADTGMVLRGTITVRCPRELLTD
jgi:hypothetical protein